MGYVFRRKIGGKILFHTYFITKNFATKYVENRFFERGGATKFFIKCQELAIEKINPLSLVIIKEDSLYNFPRHIK
jgi:hypothetical protein